KRRERIDLHLKEKALSSRSVLTLDCFEEGGSFRKAAPSPGYRPEIRTAITYPALIAIHLTSFL
ncbi:hypothetical protein ILYODFUR_017913, partial [Ilyodon furcidens]